MDIGFLPCFSKYLFGKYPIEKVYENKTFINKLQVFLSALLVTANPHQLQTNGACHKIMLLSPTDKESRRIISMCDSPKSKIYKAGFGDNKMRIIFGINYGERLCYVFALDTDHETFSGKSR
jgi:hypothetical protein